MKNIKMYTVIAMFVALLSFNGFAQSGKVPTITKTFELNQPGTLNAQSAGGGIEVISNDQSQVVVQAFVRKNGKLLSPSDPAVAGVLDDYDLNIEKNGTAITATVERRGNFRSLRNEGISLTIIVPREMSCNVSSSGGGVKASGVKGSHNFSSSGGGIHLENVTGDVEASSSGGGVHTTNLSGNIHLSSSGGGVSLNEAQGRVSVHSSGGGVNLTNIHGDAEACSSGGGVTVTGELGYLKATSSGGAVHINIAKLSKELYLKSSGGGIDAIIQNGDKLGLNLDLKSEKVSIDLLNFSGRSERGNVNGTMNNGGIPVYMRASGGKVSVRFND